MELNEKTGKGEVVKKGKEGGGCKKGKGLQSNKLGECRGRVKEVEEKGRGGCRVMRGRSLQRNGGGNSIGRRVVVADEW